MTMVRAKGAFQLQDKEMVTFKQFVAENDLWLESGYAHVRQMLMGVLKVQTIGFITAENPHGQPLGSEENRQKNYSLWSNLRGANYGPIQIQGAYNGNMEYPFMVQNIAKEELIKLGEQYAQESVIFGKRFVDKNGNPFFQFEFIKRGQTVSTRFITVSGAPIADRNTYSAVKGRKFVIPFFDDEYANYVPGQKLGTINFTKEELPIDEKIQGVVQEIQQYEIELGKTGYTEKHYWMNRGLLRARLDELNKLMGMPVEKSAHPDWLL